MLETKLRLSESAIPPESAKLSREPWAAGERWYVTNMKLHLGGDQVLMSQQLQLPHPNPLQQLEGNVLRVGTQPTRDFSHKCFLNSSVSC